MKNNDVEVIQSLRQKEEGKICAVPEVSIIMPSFNVAEYISQAIESVLRQNFDSWELLIVDDGSSDLSYSIAEKYAAANDKISLSKNQFTKGAAGARNYAISLSRGRYIAFLDADDMWLPGKLSAQMKFIKQNNVGFCYSFVQCMNESGEPLQCYKAPSWVGLSRMKTANFVPCLTVILDTELVGTVEQPNIKKRNDFALWLKILRENRGMKAICYEEVTALYRINSYGLSGNRFHTIPYFRRCLVEYAHCSLLSSYFYTFIYLCISILKKKAPTQYNFFVSVF